MRDVDYFNESVPDGITNAIDAYDENIECSNQDSFELLVRTFGSSVCGNDLKLATESDLIKFASVIKDYFELSYLPTAKDAEEIIHKALVQWGDCSASI